MKLFIILVFGFYIVTVTQQQLVPVTNETQTSKSNTETIDGSLPGQGIPKQLVELFPQIDQTTTTQIPRAGTRRRPTYSNDERIPPNYQHLYPSTVVESTSESVEETRTDILTATTPKILCDRVTITEITTPSTTTTTRKPRRRMRPGRRRKPIRDPAERARARQRAAEMDQRIPPAFAHLYTTTIPPNQTETYMSHRGGFKKTSKTPQTTTTAIEVKEDDVGTRMGSSKTRHYPDDERIPPAFRHLYPNSSSNTTTQIPLTTTRQTELETARPHQISFKGFNDNDRRLLEELDTNFKLMVRLEDQHLKKLTAMEERLTNIQENFNSKLENLHDKIKSLVEQMASLEDQKRRVDSALYIVRKNFSQIKNEMKSKSNSTNTRVLNDLMRQMGTISTMVEAIQNTIDKNRARKSLPYNSIQTNLTVPASVEQNETDNYSQQFPENCLDVKNNGYFKNDIYRIYPRQSSMSFFVFCENGWIVIQNRNSGNLDFMRGWNDYRLGFGNIADEFWLGLEKIYILTNFMPMELLIELEDFNMQKRYAHYKLFSIGSESEGYNLNILGNYDGDAGDSLKYHAGQKFSTFDRDYSVNELNCAYMQGGGWWYKDCGICDLNGYYVKGVKSNNGDKYKGIYWETFGKDPLKKSRMLIRPVTKT